MITAIICTRKPRPICKYCPRTGTKLCDFPLHGAKEGQTCDARLCSHHAITQEGGSDYCPPHDNLARKAKP